MSRRQQICIITLKKKKWKSKHGQCLARIQNWLLRPKIHFSSLLNSCTTQWIKKNYTYFPSRKDRGHVSASWVAYRNLCYDCTLSIRNRLWCPLTHITFPIYFFEKKSLKNNNLKIWIEKRGLALKSDGSKYTTITICSQGVEVTFDSNIVWLHGFPVSHTSLFLALLLVAQ